jgi:hypothetical protein
MRSVKRLNKKYINRVYLINLLEIERSSPIWKVVGKMDHEQAISLQELKRCLRVCTYYYLHNVCINTVFTSGKLERITKREHLKRRREVLTFLQAQFTSPNNRIEPQ